MRIVLMIIFCLNALAAATAAEPPKAAKKTKTETDLLPKAGELSDDVSTPAKDSQRKDSKWVDPATLKPLEKSATPKRKVTLTATCTDSIGKSYASTDAGYAGCIKQMQASDAASAADGVDKASDTNKPSVGAGFNYKLGN